MYRYIIPGVIRHLEENMALSDFQIGSTIDGRPPAIAPTVYTSVYPTGRSQEYADQYQVIYPFTITVSIRRNAKSMDRIMGELYYGHTDDPGLDFWVDNITSLLHGGDNPKAWECISVINNLLQDNQPDINGIDQPFRLLSERILRVDGTWWGGEANDIAGLSSHLSFSGVARIAPAAGVL